MSKNNSFIVLYTCLTLLLLCFFIFLVANSVVDPQRKKEAIGSLIGAFGFFRGGISPTGSLNSHNIGFSRIPLSKDQHLIQDLYEIVHYSSKSNLIKINTKGSSIVLTFKKNSIFKTDSININNSYIPVLMRIYNRLSNVPDLKLKIKAFHKKNFYIASYRAFNVAEFFLKKGLTKNEISSYGELTDKNFQLMIFATGSGSGLSSKNENIIKEGDFIFKVK